MPSHLALLRGINVGGRNRVAMADLSAVVRGLGHAEVSTYIQSGNVLFSSAATDEGALARELEGAISERLGVAPAVVVLARAELAAVIAGNPFPDEPDQRCLHAVIHREPPGPERVAEVAEAERLARARGDRDEARVHGRTLYLRTPGGMGRSDLASRLTGVPAARRGDPGTARNWATVTRLMGLLEA